MDNDFVYENAPLGEVVAELFWKLTPVSSVPGAAVDPFFDTTLDGFTAAVAKLGFASVERLIPLGVPLELVAGQPVARFRAKQDSWPLYQLGAGVFTSNVVPPYGGWNVFRNTLRNGIAALFANFPAADVALKVNLLRLRYINGFDATHGYSGNPLAYMHSHLGLNVAPPASLLSSLGSSAESVVPAYEVTMPIGARRELTIKALVGQKSNSPALVVDLWFTQKEEVPSGSQAVCDWFDVAHNALHDTFENLLTEEARKLLGKKLPTGDVR